MRRHGWSVRALGAHQLDARGLPSWMTFTRGAGSWSRQTAAAVDGTTFIELGTSQNTPRFDYDPTSGRTMLLIEPTRTNLTPNPLLADTLGDDIPAGWAVSGTPGVDFDAVETAGPHGGYAVRILPTVAVRGAYKLFAQAPGTVYQCSQWIRRTAAVGAAQAAAFFDNAAWSYYQLGSATHDWRRYTLSGTAAGANGYSAVTNGDAQADAWSAALVQQEAGDSVSSFVDGTRADELLALDPSVVGRSSGTVSLLWRPDFASTAALTVDPALFAWAPNWELLYDPADDKLKVMVNGTKRAASAALSFARQALLRVTVRYGSAGQQLTVVGGGVSAAYTDATAWGTPTLAPYLGSRAASANCRPAGYGDLLLAA